MRNGLSAALVNTGTIFFCFGFTIAVLGLLGARYGAPIHKQPMIGGGGLLVGGAMILIGYFMGRSKSNN